MLPVQVERQAADRCLWKPNVGGVINVCIGVLGWERSRSAAKVDEIYDTLLNIFKTAESEGIPTGRAADRLAERRLSAGAGQVSPKTVSPK